MTAEHQYPPGIAPWPFNWAQKMRRPGLVLGSATAIAFALLMWLCGGYDLGTQPPHWASPEKMLSMAIAYPILAAYLVGLAAFTTNRSQDYLDALQSIVDDAASAAAELNRLPKRRATIATLVGVAVAVMNVDWRTVLGLGEFPASTIDYGLSAASMGVWILALRITYLLIHNANVFRRLGAQHTRIELYRPLSVRPFAQVGILYLTVVAGALALTPLQALDATLVIENFLWAFLIGIPTGIALPLITMGGVRTAIAAAKRRELQRIDAEIAKASPGLDTRNLHDLNALLQRRTYVRELHAWPLDLRTLSRAAFYIVIPPLAWIGAALVELSLEAFLSS